MTRPALPPSNLDPDAPLRLADAAALAFPGGGMTVCGLRREAAKGRLAIMRIAGKDWTTLKAIREMMERCRVLPRERLLATPCQSRWKRPRPLDHQGRRTANQHWMRR